MTKWCYKCDRVLPITFFPINRARRDGRATMCSECKKDYNDAYYARTKTRFDADRRAHARKVSADLLENLCKYLQSHPCVDCGETDFVVLQFDHLRDKEFDISRALMHRMAWPRILEEIE